MKFRNRPVISRAVPVGVRLAASSDDVKQLHDRCLMLLKQGGDVREGEVSARKAAIRTGIYTLDKLTPTVLDRFIDDIAA